MKPDTQIFDALRQHEDRLATLLESHRQQVIDAVAHQLSALAVQSLHVHESGEESACKRQKEHQPSPQPPPARLPAAESEGATSPSGDGLRSHRHVSRISFASGEPMRHRETLAMVSDNLRMGFEEVMGRMHTHVAETGQGFCCENSACCKHMRRHATALYDSAWFEAAISLTILVNAIMMGLYAEWSIGAVHEPTPQWYRIGSACCLTIFVVEIPVRWLTEGWSYLHPRNEHFGWNVFDLVLVLSALADEVLQALQGSAFNVSFMRLTRFLRLMRVTRVLRVLKHFKELRILVFGMLNCGKPLLWASLLLGLMAYIFMVFLLLIASDELKKIPDRPSAAEQDIIDFIDAEFGSLSNGMYTLLSCITGGVSWQELADPLYNVSPVLFAGFLLYILLGMGCFLNLITAVFLEAAYHQSHSEEAQILEHIDHMRVWIRDAKNFFHDEFEQTFGSGSVNSFFGAADQYEVGLKAFMEVVRAPRVRAWFEEQGLDIYFADATSLFELLDFDSNNRVDIHEFVAGLYRLKGGASSLNMQLEVQRVRTEIKALKKYFDRADQKSGGGLSPSSARGATRVRSEPHEYPPTPPDEASYAPPEASYVLPESSTPSYGLDRGRN